MVYYLGRDVEVYITTESTEAQVDVTGNTVTTSDADEGVTAALDFATATITITDFTELNAGDKVNLVATDGTNYDFTNGDQSSVNGTWEAATSNITTAENLMNVINTSSGPSGTRFTATRASSTAVVTVTQATAGSSGNTTVTLTDSGTVGMTKTNFTGGDDDPDNIEGQTFAENLTSSLTKIPDITGVDLGVGVTDEDITYIGTKTVLKAEIKKETTITLTRKKSNNVWDIAYNGPTAASKGWTGSAAETGDYGARWGVVEGAANTWYINNGLMHPKDAVYYGGSVPCFGYRVHIKIGSGGSGEVISVPACQLVGHSISLNADGTTEETCELVSHVTPKIGTAVSTAALTAADL